MAIKGTIRVGGEVGSTTWEVQSQMPAFDGGTGSPVFICGHMYGGDGNAAQSTFEVDDEIGEIPRANLTKNLASHNVVTFTEDASGDELWLGRGRIADKRIGRHVQQADDYRYFEVTWDDGNIDFRGLALQANWARPEESGRARVLAALAAFCNGDPRLTTVIDDHLVAAGGEVTMPAHTYAAGTDLPEVFRDCASVEGKQWGAVIHHSGGSHLCLLYITPEDHTTYACTLSLSDEDTEVDFTTVFAPAWLQGDAALESGGDNPISNLVSRYGVGGDSFVTSEDLDRVEAYDYWAVPFNDSDAETAAQAQARADSILASRGSEHVTHQPTIEYLPGDMVHLVEAGMSIDIKSAASMGGQYLGTTQTRRIAQAKKELVRLPTDDSPALYHVHLQLDRPEKRMGERVGGPVGPKPPKEGIPPTAPATVWTYTWDYEQGNLGDTTQVQFWGGTYDGDGNGPIGSACEWHGSSTPRTDSLPCQPGDQLAINAAVVSARAVSLALKYYYVEWLATSAHSSVFKVDTLAQSGLSNNDSTTSAVGSILVPDGATHLRVRAHTQMRQDNVTLTLTRGSGSGEGVPGDVTEPVGDSGEGSLGDDEDTFARVDHIHEHGLLSASDTHHHDASQIEGLPEPVDDFLTPTDYMDDVTYDTASGSAHTFEDPTANVQDITLTANCTFAMPAVADGKSFMVRVRQDSTGNRTATFSDVEWPEDIPPILSTAPGAVDFLTFHSDGIVWYGAYEQTGDTISTLGFVGPLLIADGASIPFSFEDVLQADGVATFLYADT